MANQLRQWFDAIDVNRDGTLSSEELQRALAQGDLHFSLKSIHHMIRLHDTRQSGTINFQDFQNLHNFLMEMQNSFSYYDRNKDGRLSQDEIYQAISRAGFQLDSTTFHTLFDTFDPNRDNAFDLKEFIALTLFMRSCTKVFQAFDIHKTGTISLDFNQFVYAASLCS